MKYSADLKGIKRTRSVLNAFLIARKAQPKTDLLRGLHVAHMAVQQEVAMMGRLAKLPARDERRNLIPLSLQEAVSQFETFRNLAMQLGGSYVEQLANDRGSIEKLKALPVEGHNLKQSYIELLNRPPPELEGVWIQIVFAAQEIFCEAVRVGDEGESEPVQNFSRTIIFEPEHKQAAIGILSYFGEVVQQKYPKADVRIRIEQHGNVVTLIVESPSGEIEKYEKELTEYGLVVTGQRPVNEYLADPAAAMRLQHKIDMAQMELRHTRELLHSERAGYAVQLSELKAEVEFVRKIADKVLYQHAEASSALHAVALSSDDTIRAVLERFAAILETRPVNPVGEFSQELEIVQRETPSVVDRLNELLIKGSIQGAAGNYLYAALQALQRMA